MQFHNAFKPVARRARCLQNLLSITFGKILGSRRVSHRRHCDRRKHPHRSFPKIPFHMILQVVSVGPTGQALVCTPLRGLFNSFFGRSPTLKLRKRSNLKRKRSNLKRYSGFFQLVLTFDAQSIHMGESMRSKILALFILLASLMTAAAAFAQEGHPLKGSWIGDWGPNSNDRNSITIVMDWDG